MLDIRGKEPPSLVPPTMPIYEDRLEFAIPQFARVSWCSAELERAWSPQLLRLRDLWARLEVLSIVAGVRAAALQWIDNAELPMFAHWCISLGFVGLPLPSGRQSHNQTGRYPVVVGSPQTVQEFARVWRKADYVGQGRLLGYPSCCIARFCMLWRDNGIEDCVWPMTLHAQPSSDHASRRAADIVAPAEANAIWRCLGLRLVPHLPCSWTCDDTASLGRAMRLVARHAGYGAEFTVLKYVLSWPLAWSMLHGIAEVLSPIVRFSCQTDATGQKRNLRYFGRLIAPDGAPASREFPFPGVTRDTRKRLPMVGLADAEPTPTVLRQADVDSRIINECVAYFGNFTPRPSLLVLPGEPDGMVDALVASDQFRVCVAERTAPEDARGQGTGLCVRGLGSVDETYDVALVHIAHFLDVAPPQATQLVETLARCARKTLVYVSGAHSVSSSEEFNELHGVTVTPWVNGPVV